MNTENNLVKEPYENNEPVTSGPKKWKSIHIIMVVIGVILMVVAITCVILAHTTCIFQTPATPSYSYRKMG